MTGIATRSSRSGQRGAAHARDRRRRDRGQIIVMFALAMALFMFSLFVAVVDLDYLFTWSARVQAAAQVAAQSGANSVNPDFLYSGTPPIVCDTTFAGNPCRYAQVDYQRACIHNGNVSADITPVTADYQSGGGEGTACASNGCSVGATVVKHVVFPLTVLGVGADVRGQFTAAPIIGAQNPSAGQASCPFQQPPPP